MNIQEMIGKRALVTKTQKYMTSVDEVKFIEVSPSGNWVKLMNMNTQKYWVPVSDIALIEELHEFKK